MKLEKYNLKLIRKNWPLRNYQQIRELEQIGFIVLIHNLEKFTVNVYVKGV